MKDRLFEIWFSLRVGAACTEFQTILSHYGTPYDIFNAEESELCAMPISPRLQKALGDKSLDESHRIMEYCHRHAVNILFWQDENYPVTLRSLRDPPVLLYYRGRLPDFNRRLCISLVGTRSMSEYGKRMAYKIGYELAAAGVVVVSGLALGNDGVAATAAIRAGGSTVAVLGSGIDVVYPREHTRLFEEIAGAGAIMTEYPPGTPPTGYHFPVRNRIISGLSQGTVVIEGDLKSGSMITAKTAILQGRDIYALPGNIGEANAAGTNQLISEGAAVVLRARDIVDNYAFLHHSDLNMAALYRAEKQSDLDESVLIRFGVYSRTVNPRAAEPAPVPQRTVSPSVPTREGGRGARSKSVPTTPTAPKPPAKKNDDASGGRAAQTTEARSNSIGDASRRALQSLSDVQRRIFETVPIDGTIPLESLSREGFSMSDIMSTMTVLEIKGLIQTFPGGLIGRK